MGLRVSAVFAAVLVLATGEAMAKSERSRFATLFEPWKAAAPDRGLPGYSGAAKQRKDHARPAVADRERAVLPFDEGDGERSGLPPHLRRQVVEYPTKEAAGTIVIDTANTFLYFVLGGAKAIRYGIGVGREGFTWAGRERVSRMAEWPDWRPPREMIERDPQLPEFMPGGLSNPLGARALYLGHTLYRIHGTNEPSTIGRFVSSGCIRLRNEDVMDLYRRAVVGAEVLVVGDGALTAGRRQ